MESHRTIVISVARSVCLLFGVLGLEVAGANAAPAGRPNVVLIMADDMGFSDLSCYGSEIDTPHLDRLAANGLRFTQFYNTARCCPTRASLLTGLYPHQSGIGHMTGDYGHPGYRGDLNANCVTIAEVLGPAGYRCYHSGKWHVTKHIGDWTGNPNRRAKHNWPVQRGFHRSYGMISGAGSFFDPVTLTRGNTPVEPEGDRYYFTDAISEHAVECIAEHAKTHPDKPFFCYVAYTAPHWPLHALPEDIAKYQGRYDRGWDALRADRHERMKRLGIVEAGWALTPRDAGVPAWEDAEHKAWQVRRMEVYAAQIDRMDQGIGLIVEALKQTRQLENTLVLFLADNGGCAEELSGKWRGLFIPERTPDGRPVQRGNDPKVMPGPEDTYQSYGLPWANASNTPFRRYKHWVHEGGISTPLIAHWPAAIKQRGKITGQPGHVIDLMATCVDVAGASYPTTRKGKPVTPLEGMSLQPILEGKTRGGHEAIYWEHEGNRAVRAGKWKLVSRHPGEWELYDLEADRTELNNLAATHPANAKELAAMYGRWAKRARVLPWEEAHPKR